MSTQRRGEDQPGLWQEQAGPSGKRMLHSDRPSDTRARGGEAGSAPALPSRRPIKPMDYSELWTIEEVANYLGVPKQTIYSWRHTGYGPKGFRVGKHLRWRSAAVIAWTLGLENDQ